jgi:hypothetical protein
MRLDAALRNRKASLPSDAWDRFEQDDTRRGAIARYLRLTETASLENAGAYRAMVVASLIGLIRAKGFGWVDGSGAARGNDSGNASSNHKGRNRKSHNAGVDAGDFIELGFNKANA